MQEERGGRGERVGDRGSKSLEREICSCTDMLISTDKERTERKAQNLQNIQVTLSLSLIRIFPPPNIWL